MFSCVTAGTIHDRVELRRVPYKEQRTDHTTNIAWHLPKMFARRTRGVYFSQSGQMFVHEYTSPISAAWRSANQQEKRREQSRLRNEMFLIKKDNERLARDMEARQAALEKLGIKENFDFEDHHEIYSFADHNATTTLLSTSLQSKLSTARCLLQQSRHVPNIQFRSIQPSYPEYPNSEYSTKPAFNVNFERAVPRLSPQHESQHERAAGEFRARRAKAILQMHVQAFK